MIVTASLSGNYRIGSFRLGPERCFLCSSSVPVAYQVEGVKPMNSIGLCEMRLLRLHPRSRAQARREFASPSPEYSSKSHEQKESSFQSKLEEVLYEA